MAQAVSRRLVTADVRVRAQISQRAIFGGQSGTGTRFPMSCSAFPVYIIPSGLSIHTHFLGDEQ
jgi:hypothetical protein